MDLYVPPGFNGDDGDYEKMLEEKYFAQADLVNEPPHYRQGPIECIDAIQAALTPEEWRGFLKGQVIKYVWRTNYKGGEQDLQKAEWYLGRLLKNGD